MSYCFKEGIAVVPQGGNTGLVGGGVPVFDEVVISLEKMKVVRGYDDISGESERCLESRSCLFRKRGEGAGRLIGRFVVLPGIVKVDSGIILEALDQYLVEKGHMVPLDLGAKGS